MKIIEKKTEQKIAWVTSVTKSVIICNKCGKEESRQNNPDPSYYDRWHNFKATGGYGSFYPSDNETIEFDLCEECLKELIDSFVHSPKYSR